jgi:aconitate hydratase
MILKPAADPHAVDIMRGPNIGEPPSNEPLPPEVKGVVLIKLADKITTDHIMPAGHRLKYRSNIKKYSEFVFEGIDPDFARNALAIREQKKAVFILAGASYGQGSSREHAAICPMYLGVKAVLAKSFERIHSANLVNFGILPLVFVNEADYERIDKGDEIEMSGILERLERNEHVVIFNKTRNIKINMAYFLTDRQKKILKAGGLLNYTKQQSA